ncbi:7alpha-hydroxysteroid dehydrogenase [Bifidobacterium sp. UBA744]|uniref:7alpha-hydroxysteroid dehydrogenase n=1 Tax=Bifidobacterium sp. UBA744 TaxID=1946112 RepID=UPI0025B98520|nr:SDR family oxidoreductase [Bifidobacterium sp. UBA744]
MSGKLANKVVVVTAATRGIGLAIVTAAAKEGATVYLGARNMERAAARAEEVNADETVKANGGLVKTVYNDATKDETYTEMIDAVKAAEGRVDGLVNNFGTSDPRKDLDIEHTDVDTFINTLTVNLKSVFITSQAAIKAMPEEGGSIVNISSIGGEVPDISQIAYGTSKAAIEHLTKDIAVQVARKNIRCNAVLPGMTATDAVQNALNDTFRTMFLKSTPIKRMAAPEEIAAAVVYFLSDGAAFTTGQCLAVAGGFGLATPVFGDLQSLATARG